MSTKSRKRLSALKRAKTKLHRWGEDHIGCSFTSPLPTSSSTQPSSRKSFWWAGVPGGNTSSGSSPQRCRSSAWLACLVVTAFSSGAGTALTSSSCQGLQSPESRVQKDVEGEASKGAGRSLLKPGARELSLKRDNRNTRRVHQQHQRDEHLLGVLRHQVLPRPPEGCVGGGNQRSRKFFSWTRRRRHTLLEMANEDATRELSNSMKGKHTSMAPVMLMLMLRTAADSWKRWSGSYNTVSRSSQLSCLDVGCKTQFSCHSHLLEAVQVRRGGFPRRNFTHRNTLDLHLTGARSSTDVDHFGGGAQHLHQVHLGLLGDFRVFPQETPLQSACVTPRRLLLLLADDVVHHYSSTVFLCPASSKVFEWLNSVLKEKVLFCVDIYQRLCLYFSQLGKIFALHFH